jgi:hypothetical protein
MGCLSPRELHVRVAAGITPQGPLAPRRYTLTHSDSTGDLFLTIAPEVDRNQIAGWYTRLMRDEVLAKWQESDGLATEDKIAASRPLLPAATRWVAIEGGNHAQFGWYGPQSGDGTATISREEQQRQIVAATLELLSSLAAPGS